MTELIRNSTKPIVLTIAGFDPSSGAGLTADIRTLENIGVYGMSICTAITIQDADQVKGWTPIDIEQIKKQFEVLFTAYDIKTVKTGMLSNSSVIDLIVEYHQKYRFTLVVDPVIYSATGIKLADDTVEQAMRTKLFPIATIITPNRYEAEMFSGLKITDAFSVEPICAKMSESGVKNIIIKGGHIDESGKKIVDYLYNEEGFRFYPRERIDIKGQKHIHGTGCVFSSLLAGFLALGYNPEECILFAEDYMEDIFKKIFPLKTGAVLDSGYTEEEIDVLLAVQKVVEFLCKDSKFTRFIPEVRTNVSICKKSAKELKDVAAVDGRITIVAGKPTAAGPIRFGVSNHTGRLLLQAKSLDEKINAVINIKYNPETILKLKSTGLRMIEVDRSKQSQDTSSRENSSLNWMISWVFDQINEIPDIIWDCGEPEKEPMIRLFGKDAEDLLKKIKVIINVA